MRESRNGSYREEEYTAEEIRPEEKKRSGKGMKILAVIIVGVVLYFICASAFGTWIAENIIVPVFSVFEPLESEEYSQIDNTGTPETSSDIVLPDLSLYALQSGIYEDPANAQDDALSVRAKGGAGYIYEDDYMRVVVSAYKDTADAKAVHDKLITQQNFETWEYTISAPEIKLNVKAPKSDIEKLNNFFAFVKTSSEQLEYFDEAYKSGKSSIQEIKDSAEAARSEFAVHAQLLLELGQDDGGILPYILELCDALSECFVFDADNKTDVEISSVLKYNYIKYTDVYSQFLNQIRGNIQ